MKYLPLALVLSLYLFPTMVFSADQEITTAELARHLGISTWRIPKEKLPDSYVVSLYHVSNGALTKEYRIGEFQKSGDLLICTQRSTASVSISADDGNTIVSTKAAVTTPPIFTYENKFEALGAPLLLCYGDDEQPVSIEGRHKETKSKIHAMASSNAKHGLAIVITASKP